MKLSTETHQFLNILHRGGDYRFIQNLNAGQSGDKPRSAWFRVDESINVPATWDNDKANVFYGVNPSSIERDYWQASHNSDISALNCVYAEFDGKDETSPSQDAIDDHYNALRTNQDKAKSSDKALRNEALGDAKGAMYLTNPSHYKALALARVRGLNPQPSVIVDSGGGYQCFWLLDRTFIIVDDADRARAADVQKRWVNRMGGDPGVCDLRRILRLPGTLNHKRKYSPNYPLVSFIKKDFELRYSFETLAELLPTPELKKKTPTVPRQPTHQASTELHPGTTKPAGDGLIDLFNANVSIRELLVNYGYTEAGDRLRRPSGTSASVIIGDDNKSFHFSSSDPLHSEHQRSAFDVFAEFEHGGNTGRAVDAFAKSLFDGLRLLVRSTALDDYIENFYGDVYRTSSTDCKTATALYGLMEKARKTRLNVSLRRVAKLAGIGSHHTIKKALERLAGVLFSVRTDPRNDNVCEVALDMNCRFYLTAQYGLKKLYTGQFSEIDNYTPRMAQDAFLTGTARAVRDYMHDVARKLEISFDDAMRDFTHKGLGEAKLRVLDAIYRIGGSATALELVEATGKKLSSIRTACRVLEQHSLLESEREGARGPKLYSVAPDLWQKIEQLTNHLKTYTLNAQREDRRLEAVQMFCREAYEFSKEAGGDPAYEAAMKTKFEKIAHLRVPHLTRMMVFRNLSASEILAMAHDVNPSLVMHEPTLAKKARLHEKARLVWHEKQGTMPPLPAQTEQRHTIKERQEYQVGSAELKAAQALAENIAAYKASGTAKRVIFHELKLAGFAGEEIARGLRAAHMR